MKRVITYRHLPLRYLSGTMLKEQLRTNHDRILVRAGIGGTLALATLLLNPVIGLITLALCGLPCYWIWQNNQAIRAELAARQ
ncbi:MAG: hypothetical protein IKP40_03830 [Clostridia bacterium]|nr:hypothetical protein [Clostridia bacterium]